MDLGRDPSNWLFLKSTKSNENHPSKLSRIVPVNWLSLSRKMPEGNNERGRKLAEVHKKVDHDHFESPVLTQIRKSRDGLWDTSFQKVIVQSKIHELTKVSKSSGNGSAERVAVDANFLEIGAGVQAFWNGSRQAIVLNLESSHGSDRTQLGWNGSSQQVAVQE